MSEFQLEARLEDLAVRSHLTGKDLVDAVRTIDNSTADTSQNVIYNRVPPPNDWRGSLFESLALKANPSWNAGQFPALQEFKNSYAPSGYVGRTFQRVKLMAEDAAEVLEALKAVAEGFPVRLCFLFRQMLALAP